MSNFLKPPDVTVETRTESNVSRRDFIAGTVVASAASVVGGTKAMTKATISLTNQELIYMPAMTLLELFRTKKLSPVEVLNAQITHSSKVEPKINCFSFKYFDEALNAAKASEDRYMKGDARPLEGITLAVKDEHDIQGKITTNGSLIRSKDVAKTTHPLVQRMIDAGVVIHARTTTPEFSMAWVTWSKNWGVTRNPWNLYYSVGGSSGGSGCSLASGVTTFASGSDIGGSIRLPSSVAGVYGFFAPFGRVPGKPGSTFVPFAADGPMARTFDDMVLFQNAITGPYPYAMESLMPKFNYPSRYESIRDMRIGYSIGWGNKTVDRDVKKNTEDAIKILRGLGAIVEPVSIGFDDETIKKAWLMSILGGSAGGALIKTAKRGRDKMTKNALLIVEIAEKQTPADVANGDLLTYELNKKLQNAVFLKGYDALIVPTWASFNERADYDATKHKPVIEGKEVDPLIGPIMTPVFNLLNRYPVVNAPTGRARNNIPTGMQIVANGYDDLTAFRIAAAYSQVTPAFFTGNAFPDYRENEVK